MDAMEIHLDLAPGEAEVLDTGIEEMLREGRFELAHTDDREYRANLKERLHVLEVIQGKLTSQLHPSAPR